LRVPQGMKAIGVRTLRQAANAVLSKDWNKRQARDQSADLNWGSEAALEPR